MNKFFSRNIITKILNCIMRMRMSFIVYTYEEFVIVTEAPQCNKKTATGQDTDNKNIDYNDYTGIQLDKSKVLHNYD